ncbi:hypothetical protein ES332_D01G248300v1 [Gossypium tomentosum]|uniref:Uncharacterized protein n=1 Tax=Gossypium tomentosum TaxID=34277 RepID=A0A5D2MEG8_GOSTO|nr:hypothetical protein ES332_D01G248300v1 [Gossypium tomentosum]
MFKKHESATQKPPSLLFIKKQQDGERKRRKETLESNVIVDHSNDATLQKNNYTPLVSKFQTNDTNNLCIPTSAFQTTLAFVVANKRFPDRHSIPISEEFTL